MEINPRSSGEESFSPRTSFTADSPYYTSYVETEMRQVQVLSQTLQDISARAKTFGKCGALMAEATRRLALSCRLKPSSPNSSEDEDGKSGTETSDRLLKEREEAVGDEMMVVLSTLGEVSSDRLDYEIVSPSHIFKNLRYWMKLQLPKFRCVKI
jgi:hypothetical protein